MQAAARADGVHQGLRPGPGHDRRQAGCRPHVCHPMKPSTIRGIHSILSGNTAARLGHSGDGATTLRRYADPVPEVDWRATAYLAKVTAGSAVQSG